MADYRNAGTDRGDIGKEARNLLISARIRKEEYMSIIDELERDELEFDLQEYRLILEREVLPVYNRARSIGVKSLVETVEELKSIYEEIISAIEKRLS
jgi:hypothetical protein